jgi:chemotaxis protein CheZ
MTQPDQSLAEFETTLRAHAPQLIESLQKGRFDEAAQMFNELNESRNHGLYQEVGKLTRELHNAIVKLEVDTCATGGDPSPITDATDRLSYVVEMTEKAANRTMDLVEESTPLISYVSDEAQSLSADWQRFMRRDMNAEQFRDLVKRIDQFLQRTMNDGGQLSQNLSEIMLAQDFQDLTGQVIKRVTRLISELESNLLNLVLMAGQVDRVAGIQHDREAMRAEEEKKKQEKEPSHGEGPQMHADIREDVVSGQDDVDDLLSSLGF